MPTEFTIPSPAPAEKERDLTESWRLLCGRYLPFEIEGSIWRCSRGRGADDPPQGWKLHISATVLNAAAILKNIAPFLFDHGVRFKAPNSLHELVRLNSGLCYGFSQVGKVFTVYPRTEEEAVRLARRLHELTLGMRAPAVPFDLQFRPQSNVFYRYGAFDSAETRLPDGSLVPDLREPGKAKPEWLNDPFSPRRARPAGHAAPSPSVTNLRVFRALAQRGRGGVYQAVDTSVNPPCLRILKEGRRDGEVTWDGRDGRWRVRHEARVLTTLQARGVKVPRVYSSFEIEGHYYLMTEFIEGETLEAVLAGRRRRLPVASVLRYSLRVATLLAQIHDAGWVWRDCKPSNLMITREGALRPLDFEGAYPISRPDPLRWVTPAFSRPRLSAAGAALPGVGEDLYALGAIMYLLLSGRTPDASPNTLPAGGRRRNTPPEVCDLVSELLRPDPRPALTALAAARRLGIALSRVSPPGEAGP